MCWSLIQLFRLGSIAAANLAGLNCKKYVPVHTSTYCFLDSCTAMYLHVPPYTVPCTVMYNLVPPCTTLYHDCTGQYVPVHDTCMYEPRNFLCQYILVHTVLRFLVPPCRQKRMYHIIPVHTALYCHIPGVQDSRCTALPPAACPPASRDAGRSAAGRAGSFTHQPRAPPGQAM
jgi:hypothetical protein